MRSMRSGIVRFSSPKETKENPIKVWCKISKSVTVLSEESDSTKKNSTSKNEENASVTLFRSFMNVLEPFEMVPTSSIFSRNTYSLDFKVQIETSKTKHLATLPS